ILLVIEPPAVVWRVAADAGALVIGNRLRDTLLGDLLGPERFFEVRFVALHARQRCDHAVVGIAHLDRIGNRTKRLILERLRAAVPEAWRPERNPLVDTGR